MKIVRKLLLAMILVLLLLALSCSASDPLVEDFFVTDIWGEDATFESIYLTGQAVDKAPLKLLAGSLLTTPEAGTLEYDGTGIYLTNTNHRRFISQAADSIIVPVTVSNTVVETTVFTGVLNANELRANRVYRVNYYGQMDTASAADTVTIRANINGTTLATLTSSVGIVAASPFQGDIVFTVRSIGVAGTVSAFANLEIGSATAHVNTSSLVVDTTAINNIALTFQWSAAKVNNIMELDQAFMEVLD